MIEQGTLLNFVGGTWERASVSDSAPIYNPATNQVIAKVPLSDKATVDKTVAAAQAAYLSWRRVQSTPRKRPAWDSPGAMRYIDNQ